MRVNTLLSTAFGIVAVNALINDFAVPKTIKPGDLFNISAHQTSGQGYYETLIWLNIQSLASGASYVDGIPCRYFFGPYDLGESSSR